MKFPNKVTRYKDSAFPKMVIVLKALEKEDMTVLDLYKALKSKFKGVEEFIQTMDCLRFLNAVEWKGEEVLHYVEND